MHCGLQFCPGFGTPLAELQAWSRPVTGMPGVPRMKVGYDHGHGDSFPMSTVNATVDLK